MNSTLELLCRSTEGAVNFRSCRRLFLLTHYSCRPLVLMNQRNRFSKSFEMPKMLLLTGYPATYCGFHILDLCFYYHIADELFFGVHKRGRFEICCRLVQSKQQDGLRARMKVCKQNVHKHNC